MGGKLAETVTRKLQGDFINKFFPRHRRDEIDGTKGFKPLAAMILYMQGFDSNGENPETHDDFGTEMQKIEDVYTNYGCYCWIDGIESGNNFSNLLIYHFFQFINLPNFPVYNFSN